MLLTANLYRASARSLKTFPASRLGDNVVTLFSAEKNGKQKEVETVPHGRNSSCPLVELSQLQVNMSNLKFRRIKLKEEETEQGVGFEPIVECCDVMTEANPLDSSFTDLTRSCLKDGKSNFDRWMEGCQSIQEKSNFIDPEKIDNHHDSAISSCNASDCCEEDKDDKLISMEWNEGKLSEKMAEEVECNCSSGCHSISNVTSDSEAVSPTCVSPKMSQKVFSLEDELNLKMVDLPLTQLVFDGNLYYEMPVVENQFQVVQSKKMKSKSKNVVPSVKPVQTANTVNNKTSGDITKQQRKNNFSDVRDHKSKSENIHSPRTLPLNQPNDAVIPLPPVQNNMSSNDSEITRDKKTNSKNGGRKNRQNRRDKVNVTPTTSSEGEVDHHKACHDSLVVEKDVMQSSNVESSVSSSDRSTTTVNVEGSKIVSFGLNCGDLDTFGFPASENPKTIGTTSHDDSATRPNRRQFNLRQAQMFLMKAYQTVQKQQMEDSNSVFIYS